jgi:putative membrane protein
VSAAGATEPAAATKGRGRLGVGLLAFVVLGLVWTGIRPYDGPTWWLEVAPILIAIPVAVLTAKRFPLTPLVMVLLAIHAVILMVGGHWTYARVPAGDWVRDALHLQRNPYDRLGHLAQGFVPAILAREVLLRTSPLRPGKWLAVIVSSICLAVSACYEFVEWWTALLAGGGAVDFLATQGDPWDTQWDMLCALIGSILAQATLARVHDRQLARLGVARGS